MPLWIPIALLSTCIYVCGNLFDKYLLDRFRNEDEGISDANALFMFSSFFAIPTTILALYMGASMGLQLYQILIGLLAGVFNGLYLLLYLHSIARAELSRVTPVFQSVPIFLAIFGYIILNEVLTLPQMIAGLFIVAGSITLSYHKSEGRFHAVPTLLIFGASIAVSLQFVLFKYAAIDTSFWTSVLWSSVGLILFGATIFILNRNSRKHFLHIFRARQYKMIFLNFCNEIVDTTALLTLMFAQTLGPIALVQTVDAFHPIILMLGTSLLTILGFKSIQEDVSKYTLAQKIVGLLLIGIGSVYIYYPLFN